MANYERNVSRFLEYVGFVVIVAWIMFPIYWTINTSLKTLKEVTSRPPLFIPTQIHTSNYIELFTSSLFGQRLLNSVIVSMTALGISLLLCIPACYALARFKIRGADSIYFTYITFRMGPPFVLIIPLFIIYRSLGLWDTHLGLIMMYMVVDIPLITWTLTGFFEQVPIEIEEAYIMDGHTRLQTFLKIALPLASPGIIAVSLLCLIFTWNDLLFALLLAADKALTAPASILTFISFAEVKWGTLAASTLVFALPLIVFSRIIQKYLARGLTFGAVR